MRFHVIRPLSPLAQLQAAVVVLEAQQRCSSKGCPSMEGAKGNEVQLHSRLMRLTQHGTIEGSANRGGPLADEGDEGVLGVVGPSFVPLTPEDPGWMRSGAASNDTEAQPQASTRSIDARLTAQACMPSIHAVQGKALP
jgi:hypothetical protein